jgi:8-oxo-dGTP diphosphatase
MSSAGCRRPPSVWDGHPLRSARLLLRPPAEADAARLPALLDDEEMVRFTALIPHPYGPAEAEDFLTTQRARRDDGRGIALMLERVADGALVGCVGFGLETDGTPELGYWIGRAYWGQGFGAEAVRRLVRHLFETLDFPRVWATIHPDNHASSHLLRATGFVADGVATCDRPARGDSLIAPRFVQEAAVWRAAHAARPKLLVAACALVDDEGRVLMASRPAGKAMAGLWEFPGGKLAEGETPEQALIRELEEELGLDISESCLAPIGFASHDYDTFHLLMPLYIARVWEGTPTAREGQTLRWVRSTRLADLPMPPADIPLVALLREWV